MLNPAYRSRLLGSVGNLAALGVLGQINRLEQRPAAWLSSAWAKRELLVVQNSDNANAHSAQQVRIDLSETPIAFALAKADGSDLRVADQDGTTLLEHYLESWDRDAGTGIVWVLLPTIPASDFRAIFVYYGNAAATTTSAYESTFIRRPVSSTSGLICSCAITGTGAISNGTAIADATGTYSPVISGTTGTRTTTYGTPGTSQTAACDANGLGHVWSTGSVLRFSRNQYTDLVTIPGLLDTIPTDLTIICDVMAFDSTAGGRHWSKVNADVTKGIYLETTPSSTSTPIRVKANEANLQINLPRISHTEMTHIAIVLRGGNIEAYINGQYYNYPSYYTGVLTFPDLSDFDFTWCDSGGSMGGSFSSRLDVYNRALTPAEVAADFYNVKHAAAAEPGTRVVRHPDNPTVTFTTVSEEPNFVAHPTNASRVLMYYSESGYLRRCYSDNEGESWIDEGRTNVDVEHAFTFWDAATSAYWCFAPYSSTEWRIYTNTGNGLTGWTQVDTVDPPSWGNGTAGGNPCVFQYQGTWYGFFETYKDVSGNLRWRTGTYSAPALDGPWTELSEDSLDDLCIDANGMAGGMAYVGHWSGVHHLLYHASPAPGNNMTQIYYATSPDLETWTVVQKWPGVKNPVIYMVDRPVERNQVADISFLYRPNTNTTLLGWSTAVIDGDLSIFTGSTPGTPETWLRSTL